MSEIIGSNEMTLALHLALVLFAALSGVIIGKRLEARSAHKALKPSDASPSAQIAPSSGAGPYRTPEVPLLPSAPPAIVLESTALLDKLLSLRGRTLKPPVCPNGWLDGIVVSGTPGKLVEVLLDFQYAPAKGSGKTFNDAARATLKVIADKINAAEDAAAKARSKAREILNSEETP